MRQRQEQSGSNQERELLPIGDVVAALQRDHPDVTHSSLRFLEREGLITPARTPGGHRLYSPADIERIARIKSWQAQRLSLDEVRQRLAARGALPDPGALAARVLKAMLAGDPAAGQAILEADELGVPLAALLQDVLRPVLIEVGDRWAEGTLRVGQEHEISEMARDLIAELASRHAQPGAGGPPIIAACVAGERHDLGLRMVVALLRSHGHDVRFLGADVDRRFLLEELAARGSGTVLLSVTMDERLPALRETVAALGAAPTPPGAVVAGGAAVRRHAADIEQWGATPLIDDDLDRALQSVLPARGNGRASERSTGEMARNTT